jgi:rhodanese-related sulfurtransferase
VTAWLASQGRDVVNLAGGLEAWAYAGRPLVTDDGGPGTVA